jgi:hypothetical protein
MTVKVLSGVEQRPRVINEAIRKIQEESLAYVTLTGTQTLTNKTLTSPVLTTPQINDTSSDHQYVLAVNELAADRTVTLPLLGANDTFVFADFAQELTNKTLNASVAKGTWTASGTWTIPAVTLGGTISWGGQSASGTLANGGTVTTIDINGGTIDGAVIGGASAAAGTFTTVVGTTSVATAGNLSAQTGSAIPAGGTSGAGVKVSSTSNFGIFFGSGVPTLSAAQGSLYLRSDGSSATTRLYVNTDGSTGWTNVVTST